MNKRTKFITLAAVIASLYVVLTALSALFGLDKGVIQLRLSECLCVLPAFHPAAIPGVFVGCMLSSTLFGGNAVDIVCGSLATLVGAIVTYYIARRHKYLASIPPILANTVVIPFVLKYAYGLSGGLPFFALTVFVGELLSCGVIGSILIKVFPKKMLDVFK